MDFDSNFRREKSRRRKVTEKMRWRIDAAAKKEQGRTGPKSNIEGQCACREQESEIEEW